MEANKERMAAEKKKKLAEKQEKATVVASKKKLKEQWSMKNVKAAGDRLHAAIKANQRVQGYRAPYCSYMPAICKENQRVALVRRRAKKRKEDANHIPPLCEVRPVAPTFFYAGPLRSSGNAYLAPNFMPLGTVGPSPHAFSFQAAAPAMASTSAVTFYR